MTLCTVKCHRHYSRLGETAQGEIVCDEKGHIKVGDNGLVNMATGDFVIQNPTFRES